MIKNKSKTKNECKNCYFNQKNEINLSVCIKKNKIVKSYDLCNKFRLK